MMYAIVENGAVTQTLKANYAPDAPFVEVPDEAKPGDLWDGTTLTPVDPPPAPPRTQLTRLEFRNQFTTAEKLALYSAAKTDDLVQILLDDVAAAEYIELTDQSTIDAVGYLGQSEVIESARVSEILAGV